MSGGAAVLPPYLGAGPSIKADDMAQMLEALRRMTNWVFFNRLGTASAAITATTFTAITSGSVAFTKVGGATASSVIAFFYVSCFKTAGAATKVQVAVNDGTTDWTGSQFVFSTASEHMSHMGVVTMTGQAAGAYTMALRAKLDVAGGTLTIDANDTCGMVLMEVPA